LAWIQLVFVCSSSKQLGINILIASKQIRQPGCRKHTHNTLLLADKQRASVSETK
jgi:hypothetical protein